jgi:hypothetical protein
MEPEKADCAAIVLCGDFNGAPHEGFHAALRSHRYTSAYAAVHGDEPRVRIPAGANRRIATCSVLFPPVFMVAHLLDSPMEAEHYECRAASLGCNRLRGLCN